MGLSGMVATKLDEDCEKMSNTNVSLELDFAAQKKGAWPSRPCGDWSTRPLIIFFKASFGSLQKRDRRMFFSTVDCALR